MRREFSILLLSLMLMGCTTWTPQKVIKSSEVIEKTPRGAPHVEESSNSEARIAGRATSETDIYGNPVESASGSGQMSSVKRTRCMQSYDILTLRSYDLDHQLERAWVDYTVGGVLVLGGAATAIREFNKPDWMRHSDPNYGTVALGALFFAGGAALITHAIIKSGNKPEPVYNQSERVSETLFLDSTGCPGFGGATESAPSEQPANSGDTAKRLRELKELLDSGVLTEEEYETRRKVLVDQL